MTALIAAITLSLTFPPSPILDEVEAGKAFARTVIKTDGERALGLKPGSGRHETLFNLVEPFKKPLGYWSDGGRKLEVEYGIEISPALVSRWLGYLSVRELWDDQELELRWDSIRAKVEGKRFFVVVLSAFPTQPRFGIGEDVPQSDIETKQVIFTLESSMGRTEPNAILFHHRRSKGKGDLEEVPWWTLTPFEAELTSVFQGPYEVPIIQRGDYYRTWWLIWSHTDLGDGDVTMKIASKRKIRVAEFPG